MSWVLLWTIVFSNIDSKVADTLTSGSAYFNSKEGCELAAKAFEERTRKLDGFWTKAKFAAVCVTDGVRK